MNASQIREFADVGILAAVMAAGADDYLRVDENGILQDVPKDVSGFHLVVAVPDESRTFVVQKNVGLEGGAYHRNALSRLEDFPAGFRAEVMSDPIEVCRAGQNVWCGWHAAKPNRVDCWYLGKDHFLGLFQVGVITHDDGRTWKLHGEWRWRGTLYHQGKDLVAIPLHPGWGSLEGGSSNRTQIFAHPDFQKLLKGLRLRKFTGKPEDVEPKLPSVPKKGQAVVQWYITFAGQTGQGPANLHTADGQTAWIHGKDIVGLKPDEDGEIRLWQGDIVSFERIERFGSKPGKPPKLTSVKLVKREW